MSWKTAASLSGQLLAIYGAVALCIPLLKWVSDRVFRTDAEGVVRIICDPYAFVGGSADSMQLSQPWRLVGVQLIARRAIPEARLRVKGLTGVMAWDLQGESFSIDERRKFLSSLPIGVINGPIVSASLPPIPAEQQVSILGIAMFDEGSQLCAHEDSLGLISSSSRFVHTDPSHLNVQGGPSLFVTPPQALILLIVGAAAVLLFALVKRKRQTTGEP